MGNRLYVGNLSFKTTTEALTAAFAAAGEVREVTIPTDRETGQPRGFAFVTMGSDAQAAAAIQQMNGSLLDGRPLKVNEAQERAPRGGGFGGGGGGGFGGGGGGGGFGGGGGGRGGGGRGGGGGGRGGRGDRGDRY
jgi:RNA recognition motif-containing protein